VPSDHIYLMMTMKLAQRIDFECQSTSEITLSPSSFYGDTEQVMYDIQTHITENLKNL
jgi:hypothetical protein